jgi:hypothetical protein
LFEDRTMRKGNPSCQAQAIPYKHTLHATLVFKRLVLTMVTS